MVILTWALLGYIKDNLPQGKKELINKATIGLIIWAAAFLFWVNIPVESSMFIDLAPDPMKTIYPSSDSFYYDKESLRLINGEKFIDNSTHVLYSFFLSGLHAIGGIDYQDIIPLQVAVLSLIPVFLYLLSAKITSQVTSFFVAGLYILRERNNLLLAGELSTGAVVNQLMAENLALLSILIITYSYIAWLQDEEKNTFYLIYLGALIGTALLIRIDLLAAILGIVFGSFFVMRGKKYYWFKSMTIILMAAVLVLAPWMFRSKVTTGHVSIDKGGFVSSRLTEYKNSIRQIFNLESQYPDGFQSIPSSYGGAYSGDIRYLSRHIINSLEMSVLYLPSSHQPFLTLGSLIEIQDQENGIISSQNGYFSDKYIERYVRSNPYFWYTWDGKLPFRSVIPIISGLFLLAIGIRRIWIDKSEIIILLTLSSLGHIFVWAFAGFSGGRFIKIVDWIPLLYYGVGLTFILQILLKSLNDKRFNFSQRYFGDISYSRGRRVRILPRTACHSDGYIAIWNWLGACTCRISNPGKILGKTNARPFKKSLFTGWIPCWTDTYLWLRLLPPIL